MKLNPKLMYSLKLIFNSSNFDYTLSTATSNSNYVIDGKSQTVGDAFNLIKSFIRDNTLGNINQTEIEGIYITSDSKVFSLVCTYIEQTNSNVSRIIFKMLSNDKDQPAIGALIITSSDYSWRHATVESSRTITISNNFSDTIQVKDSMGGTSNISANSSKSWTVKNGEAIGVCCLYGGASQWIYNTGTVNKTYTINVNSTQDWVTTNIVPQYSNLDTSFKKTSRPYASSSYQTPSVFNRSSLATHVRLYDPESNITYEAQIPGDVPNNWEAGQIKYTYNKCWSVSSNSKYVSFFVWYEDDPDYTNEYTTLGVSNNSSSSSEPQWVTFIEQRNIINIIFGYYKTSYTIAWS